MKEELGYKVGDLTVKNNWIKPWDGSGGVEVIADKVHQHARARQVTPLIQNCPYIGSRMDGK